jgi:glycosyltransferase involved in cell wall biosynthesis
MTSKPQKILATIGMLTYNSEKNLARALASVADFAEIIIADGGSTDATLSIAAACGARVIEQSNTGHSISDFARERNLTLAAATQPWFFYLDSDEIMSPELVEHIRVVTSDPEHHYGAYRVRYLKTNADVSKTYRTYKEYYQIRLVRTSIGARFERPVHERIIVPLTVSVGQTEAPWFVPLDADDLSFRIAARKIWKRTGMETREWRPHDARETFLGVVGTPLMRIAKSLFKMVAVKIRYGRKAIPARYEMLRILYAYFLAVQCLRRLW